MAPNLFDGIFMYCMYCDALADVCARSKKQARNKLGKPWLNWVPWKSHTLRSQPAFRLQGRGQTGLRYPRSPIP